VRIDPREASCLEGDANEMLGFIVGTLCLIGLIKVLRAGRGWHHFGAGYGGCGHGYGSRGGWGGGGGLGRRWLLRSLFERLETTPGQEKAILAALDELRGNRTVVHEELQATRADVARAVQGGLVDDGALEETFARHDRLLAQLRVSFVEALKKVTEALDERQRKQLAELLQGRGFFGGPRWGGPYRGPFQGGMWA
jgi:Spy/CpxP family protein refolding chaperone